VEAGCAKTMHSRKTFIMLLSFWSAQRSILYHMALDKKSSE
jgi:hypothetical protein